MGRRFGASENLRFQRPKAARKIVPIDVTVTEKKSIFEHHLRGFLGPLRLDEIDVGAIQRLKAVLDRVSNRCGKPLSLKTRNNILGVVSNALTYAREVDLIDQAPRIRPYKFERPQIECWELAEWGRILDAARVDGNRLLIAALLAGDAGLRWVRFWDCGGRTSIWSRSG